MTAAAENTTESTALAVVPTSTAVSKDNPPPQYLALGENFTRESWQVMTKQFFPEAKSLQTIMLVGRYCKARRLDPMTKPLHIVSMWNSKTGQEEDAIWPGIALYEITAHRTGEFAGKEPTLFGDVHVYEFEVAETRNEKAHTVKLAAPHSAAATVYRMVKGVKCAFTEEVFFDEAVSKSKAGKPTSMWMKRPKGQLAKCALAAALRLAFPEECGSEPTAEEMEGKEIHSLPDNPSIKNVAERANAIAEREAKAAESEVEEAEEIDQSEPAEEKSPPKPTTAQGLQAAKEIAEESGNLKAADAIQTVIENNEKIEKKQVIELNKFAIARGYGTNALVEHLTEAYGLTAKNWADSLTKTQFAETQTWLEANRKK